MRCEVCNREVVDLKVVSSIFGPISFGCCTECLANAKEPYNLVVSYIAQAGNYPEDLTSAYIKEVRRQLILHNKSEEQFIKDVEITTEALTEDLSLVG